MEIKSKIESLSQKFEDLKEQIGTEEATKTAFVLPFISALGYDVFSPVEVVPEFVADVGLKKGEKVDYAIMIDGQPSIIFECKHWKEDLSNHTSQLHRYYGVSKSKFGVLTNGYEYRFYTDLVKPNIMDEKPFFSFSINNMREQQHNELLKFHKSNFDENKITINANTLKYVSEVKNVFKRELEETSEDFAKFFASRIVSGVKTKKIVSEFMDLVPKGINQFINEKVNSRLQSAITKEAEEEIIEEILEESKIVTTDEELDAYRIVIAISRRVVSLEKIAHKDTQSYFGILFENNVRKPICRLYLDTKTKYIGLFDENKKETRHIIESIDDIYLFEKQIIEKIKYYNIVLSK
ncbi:MAG: type I restriction endonuclease [Flavobacteriales bacterium]